MLFLGVKSLKDVNLCYDTDLETIAKLQSFPKVSVLQNYGYVYYPFVELYVKITPKKKAISLDASKDKADNIPNFVETDLQKD